MVVVILVAKAGADATPTLDKLASTLKLTSQVYEVSLLLRLTVSNVEVITKFLMSFKSIPTLSAMSVFRSKVSCAVGSAAATMLKVTSTEVVSMVVGSTVGTGEGMRDGVAVGDGIGTVVGEGKGTEVGKVVGNGVGTTEG